MVQRILLAILAIFVAASRGDAICPTGPITVAAGPWTQTFVVTASQNCSFTLNFDTSKYAIFALSWAGANITNGDVLSSKSQFGDTGCSLTGNSADGNCAAAVPAPSITVHVESSKVTKVNFTVLVQLYELTPLSNLTLLTTSLDSNGQPAYLAPGTYFKKNVIEFMAPDGVLLNSNIDPNNANAGILEASSIFVYKGSLVEPILIGNLIQYQNEILATTQAAIFLAPVQDINVTAAYLIAMDHSALNGQSCARFTVLFDNSQRVFADANVDKKMCSVTVVNNAKSGLGMVVNSMSSTSPVTARLGAFMSNSSTVLNFSPANMSTEFPQQFPGIWTFTYNSSIEFVAEVGQSGSLTASDGHSGIVFSNNYGTNSTNQDSAPFRLVGANNAQYFYFTFTVSDPIMVDEARIEVTVQKRSATKNATIPLNQVNVTGSTFEFYGRIIDVAIFGGNGTSTGTRLGYSTSYNAPVSPSTVSPPSTQPPTTPTVPTTTTKATSNVLLSTGALISLLVAHML